MTELNYTHEKNRKSWLTQANQSDSDFPIQNLPFCVFRKKNSQSPWHIGVGIGDQILDLFELNQLKIVAEKDQFIMDAASNESLNALMTLGPDAWKILRFTVFDLLEEGYSAEGKIRQILVPQSEVEYSVPAQINDYTDFYTSEPHAVNVSKQLGINVGDNFYWLPIAYHGRSSSIVVSGEPVFRPYGQLKSADSNTPVYGACQKLDYELELGAFIGLGNERGKSIALSDAPKHVFGLCLLNDWSARDIQGWEMQPLGPFLAKNFATTISPWIVTSEALLPYRCQWSRNVDHPQPLDYLDSDNNREYGAYDIQLEVSIQSEHQASAGQSAKPITLTSFKHQYWTIGQMIAHHSVGGCNFRAGDLIGSGTISGPSDSEAGALIELTQSGNRPVDIGDGETRGFLQNGDTVIFKGWCEKEGFVKIGFGLNFGKIF